MDERLAPPSMLRSVTTGIGAGIGATLMMSLLMVAADRFGLMGQHPPSKISDRILDAVSPFHSSEETDAVGTVIHFGLGAMLGAVFATFRRLIPAFRIPGAGVVYALAVWASSYAGLLPALGVMPPPDRDRPGRQPAMIAAHVVFGLALGVLTRGVARGREARPPAA